MVDIIEVLRVLREKEIDVEKLEQVKGEVEEIDKQINELKEQIRELEKRKEEILSQVPEEIRALIFGKRTIRTGAGGNKGRYKVYKDGQYVGGLREVFYQEFPEKQGKSYKSDYMIKKLEEIGYTVEVE